MKAGPGRAAEIGIIGRLAIGLAAAMLGIAGVGGPPITAQPLEYRLKVVSLHEDTLLSFLHRGETGDGAAGRGLDALAARLDGGDLPRGGVLLDRPLRPAGKDVAGAWVATPLRVEVKRGGGRGDPWDEVRWEGAPGQHTVWVIEPGHRQPQDLRRIALQGAQASLRHHLPSTPALSSSRLTVASLPLAFVRSLEQRGAAWPRIAELVNLEDGIAAVVAVSEDGVGPDRLRLIVRHAQPGTRYRAVLGWRTREPDRENPSYQ